MPDCTALSPSYTTARCRQGGEAGERVVEGDERQAVGKGGAGGRGREGGKGGVGGEEKQPLSKVPKLHGAS